MSDVTLVSSLLPVQEIGGEKPVDDFELHVENPDQDSIPQGVLTLIAQLLPREPKLKLPMLGGALSEIARPASKSIETHSQTKTQTRTEGTSLRPARVPVANLRLADTPESIKPQAGVTRIKQTPESVPSSRIPPQVAGVLAVTADVLHIATDIALMDLVDVQIGAAGSQGLENEGVEKEAVEKKPTGLPQAFDRNALSSTRGPAPLPQSGQPEAGSQGTRARLIQTPAVADRTDAAYLRLPFSKEAVTGIVNVNKSALDLSMPLQLSSSNTEISRQLTQHLEQAPQALWRMADSEHPDSQQGRDHEQAEEGESEAGQVIDEVIKGAVRDALA